MIAAALLAREQASGSGREGGGAGAAAGSSGAGSGAGSAVADAGGRATDGAPLLPIATTGTADSRKLTSPLESSSPPMPKGRHPFSSGEALGGEGPSPPKSPRRRRAAPTTAAIPTLKLATAPAAAGGLQAAGAVGDGSGMTGLGVAPSLPQDHCADSASLAAAVAGPEAMAGQPLLSDSAPSDPPSSPSSSPSPGLGAAPPPSPGFGASIVALVSGFTSYAWLKYAADALARGLGKFFTRYWSRTRSTHISVGAWMAVPLAFIVVSVDQVAIRVAVWCIYLGLAAREIRAMGDWALPVSARTAALTCSLALALMEVLAPTRGPSLALYFFGLYLPLEFIVEPL